MPALPVQTPYVLLPQDPTYRGYSGAGERRRLELRGCNPSAPAGRWRMPLRRKPTTSSDSYGEVDSADEICYPRSAPGEVTRRTLVLVVLAMAAMLPALPWRTDALTERRRGPRQE